MEIFFLILLLFSVIVHEVSHGAVALALGDPTAKYAGRLTMNPMKHIDPFGTILLPVMLFFISNGSMWFGWAKPVPYNPHNLRNQRWGSALVGVAGPLSNIALAMVFGISIRALFAFDISSLALVEMFAGGVIVNLSLAAFNLFPIPPLDGSKLLLSVLPYPFAERVEEIFNRYGLFLILVLFWFASDIFRLLNPITASLFTLFSGLSW